MATTKKIYGKTYRYYASESSLNMAKKRAETLRKRDSVYATVKKDERPFASTYHVYVRKRR